MLKPARVLVLDGHTNQALAVVRSLGRAGHDVLVASPWRRSLASWSRHCAGTIPMTSETLTGFDEVRRIAADRGVTAVLPMTERSCVLCSAGRGDWERSGIQVGCAPLETLMRAFDKRETLRYAERAGVRYPVTISPASLEEARQAADTVGFPCVVKPRFSHPWVEGRFLPDVGCGYASTPEELDEAVTSRRHGDLWPLVQAFVPGTGKGVFALCDHGRVLSWFAHERLRDVRPSGSGSSVRRSVRLSPRLREPAEALLESMCWHGPAMVEFRESEGERPYLMEVNGRFWNSLELAIEAGVDFPRLWLSVLMSEDVAPPMTYREGVTIRWLLGDVKRLLYVLAGPPAGFSGTYPSVWESLRDLVGPQTHPSRQEIWQAGDPWPVVGEWTQAARQLLTRRSA
jgi:predicted ATP-grasp superfamily ATP-dependent carboligase